MRHLKHAEPPGSWEGAHRLSTNEVAFLRDMRKRCRGTALEHWHEGNPRSNRSRCDWIDTSTARQACTLSFNLS